MHAQRSVAQDAHLGDPTVSKPVCAERLVRGKDRRLVFQNAICYENVACAAFGGKLAVKRVHVQRLVNRHLFRNRLRR